MIGVDTTFLVELEIEESLRHRAAKEFFNKKVIGGRQQLALAPQVLMEFVHVVTDPKRFERPLQMSQALTRALFFWQAREVSGHIFYPFGEKYCHQ